ncbi:myc-associated zinc finger protein [Fukomys damarensis]|uniref:myc-associated zinc finger protein n=1 Tax=Fukomys damarensis TaxID=885580 RepID=UPI0008FECC76|nr:myc-associated zinc finger protein [Fukomys damarensis]
MRNAVVAPTSTVAVAPVASALEKKTKSKGPYICALCAKEFKNGYNLRRHEAIHTGAKAGRVPTGAMKMPTMVPLSLLSVPAAGGVVTTTASGKRIRKNHACEMCGKAFRDVYHLNRHKLSHSDEKPYQCPVCQQRFKRKDRMSYHVRSHDGAVHKPYNCSHCGKSFSRPDHLNSHVRQVHSTERPFKCEVGGRPLGPALSRLSLPPGLRSPSRPRRPAPRGLDPVLVRFVPWRRRQRQQRQRQRQWQPLPQLPAYLRIHAVKDHGLQAPRADRILCKLCSVHCKTPAQLAGHMQTHLGGAAPPVPGDAPQPQPTC